MANTFLQGSASSAVGTSTPTFQFSYPSNTTAGSLLYFVFRSNTFTTVSAADNQGNSWVVQHTLPAGTVGYTEGYALSSRGGAVTVTLTFNANIGGLLGCWAEYSGPNAVRQSTVPNSVVAGGSPVAANSSAIVYQVGDLVISGFIDQNDTSPTLAAPAGFTLREKQTFAAGYFTALGDALNVASNTSPISWGTVTSETAGIGAVAFFTTFSISGNAGTAGATVSWSGAASGSTTADGSGNYTIPNLANGSYTITPSKTGFTFSPTSSNQTVNNANITGVNFTATSMGNAYSVPDSRVVTTTTPNSSRTVNGTKIYDVPKVDSRAAGAPVDSRVAPNIPVASGTYPQNSRTPGTFGPGE